MSCRRGLKGIHRHSNNTHDLKHQYLIPQLDLRASIQSQLPEPTLLYGTLEAQDAVSEDMSSGKVRVSHHVELSFYYFFTFMPKSFPW